MTILTRVRVFAAKTEATVGTAESLAAADAVFNVQNLKIQPNIEVSPREGQGGFGRLSSVPGAYTGTATFVTNLGYSGSALPAWATVLLPACGVPFSSTTFRPKSQVPAAGSDVKTITIGGYYNGKYRGLSGAMGNVKFFFPTGQSAYAEWSFQGAYITEIDTALITPDYPQTEIPLRAAGGASTWASVPLFQQQATLDLANVIEPRFNTAQVSGYHSFVVTDRNPKITANPESKLIATQDRHSQFLGMTEGAWSLTLDGPGTSTIVFSAPSAQIINNQEGDRNGLMTDEIEWQLNRNGDTADQEFSIAFTHTA